MRNGDGDDSEPPLKRPRLTRKNLALLEKMEKKKTSAPSEQSTDSSSSSSSSSTPSITNTVFAKQASRNGILPPHNSKPPTNLAAIRSRHARSRTSASPSESDFKRYINKVRGACNKTTMLYEVSWKLLKAYDDDKEYTKTISQAFDRFPRGVGFNDGLPAPRPDFAEGLAMRAFRPFVTIDEDVEGAVLCGDGPYSLTLAHLAGEWEGNGGDMKRAEVRGGYDGAALVYAREKAVEFVGGCEEPPGKAEVVTFTTDGTRLDFWAHYAAKGEGGRVEYHQCLVESVDMTGSYQGFKHGRRALRNQQDWARERAYALRDRLKETWKERRGRCPAGDGGS